MRFEHYFEDELLSNYASPAVQKISTGVSTELPIFLTNQSVNLENSGLIFEFLHPKDSRDFREGDVVEALIEVRFKTNETEQLISERLKYVCLTFVPVWDIE